MKNVNPNRIKFYEFLNGDIEKGELENWIYSNQNLENEFSEDHYVDLISYPYKSGDPKTYIHKLVTTFFSYEEYELWRTIKLLDEIAEGEVETVLATRKLRKLYKEQEDSLESPLISVTLGIGFESALDDCPIESEYDRWNKTKLRTKLKQVELYRTDVIDRARTENDKLKLKMISNYILDGDYDRLRELNYSDEPKGNDLLEIVKLFKKKDIKKVEAIILNRFPNAIEHYNQNEKQNLITNLISEISEDIYCAGWYSDIEFDLWTWINDELTIPEGIIHRVEKLDLIELQMLSKKLKLWAYWCKTNEEKSIGINEWKELYKEKKADNKR